MLCITMDSPLPWCYVNSVVQRQEVINSIKDGVQKNAERSHRVFQEKVGILFEDR